MATLPTLPNAVQHDQGGSMTAPSASEVTQLLLAWSGGDQSALERLVPLVHQELHRLAKRHMSRERLGHTLQTTALVNEAYLRLINVKQVSVQNRAQFFGLSARIMRNILVDFARSRPHSGGNREPQHVALDEALTITTQRGPDLVALDEALDALTRIDPRQSRIVELRFFGGLSVEETAELCSAVAGTTSAKCCSSSSARSLCQ